MTALKEEEIHAYNEAVLARIRQLCVRRGSSITKLEKALGYGNGTVSGWTKAKKKAPYDRIEAIAAYLGVPTVGLTGELRPGGAGREEPELEDILRWVRSAGKEELLELLSAATLRLKEL